MSEPMDADTVSTPVNPLSGELSSSLTRMGETVAPRVFSAPVHSGDRVVITAAAVQMSGGFGFGSGQDPNEGGGQGGGLGGHTEGRPVAVIDISPEGVRIRPVLDYTKIGLAVLSSAFAIWRVTRRASKRG